MLNIPRIFFLVPLLVLVALFFYWSGGAPRKPTILIIQTVTHPALDAARLGFEARSKELFGESVCLVVKNGQGDIGQLNTAVQQLCWEPHVAGFFAIATPAAQVTAQIVKEKPVFIAAVTDPVGLGIISSAGNVCGTTDEIHVEKQLGLIKTLLPNLRRVGILFNVAEHNSQVLVKKMNELLKNEEIVVVPMGVNSIAEIPLVLSKADSVDAVWAPTDNNVASAIDFIADQLKKKKKPLFVSDLLLVQHGAFAGYGVDYELSGKLAADCAYEVLMQKSRPDAISLKTQESDTLLVNKNVAQELGLLDIAMKNASVRFWEDK